MSRLQTKRRTFLRPWPACPACGLLVRRLTRPPPRRRRARPRRDPGAGRPVVHQRGRHVHGADRLADAARGRGGDAGRLAQVSSASTTCTTPSGKRIAELLGLRGGPGDLGLRLGALAGHGGLRRRQATPRRIRRLPDTTGMKNEVLVQKTHRVGYDHAIRNAGVQADRGRDPRGAREARSATGRR